MRHPVRKERGGKKPLLKSADTAKNTKLSFSLQISRIMVPVDANLIAAKFDGT